jgi:hypothetical protein
MKDEGGGMKVGLFESNDFLFIPPPSSLPSRVRHLFWLDVLVELFAGQEAEFDGRLA